MRVQYTHASHVKLRAHTSNVLRRPEVSGVDHHYRDEGDDKVVVWGTGLSSCILPNVAAKRKGVSCSQRSPR